MDYDCVTEMCRVRLECFNVKINGLETAVS